MMGSASWRNEDIARIFTLKWLNEKECVLLAMHIVNMELTVPMINFVKEVSIKTKREERKGPYRGS